MRTRVSACQRNPVQPASAGVVRQIGRAPLQRSAPRCQTGSLGFRLGLISSLLTVAAHAQAPALQLVTTNGQTHAVAWLEASADLAAVTCQPPSPKEPFVLPLHEVLALHGPGAVPTELPAAWFAGGEVVRGQLVDGDAAGETLRLQSPVLGATSWRVERLAALLATGNEPLEQLVLPQGASEALFRRAKLGLDASVGTLHAFGARGILFAAQGAAEPHWHALHDVVGLRIGDPLPNQQPADANLWTRIGDRLAVRFAGADRTGLLCQTEGGTLRVAWSDVASVVWQGRAQHLSHLEPTQVVENGYAGEVLHGWRRDAAVLGGPLTAAGMGFGFGLGVHSRSVLTYRVPPGVDRFWSRVALDDSVQALPLHASATVSVRLDGEIVWRHEDLRSGQAVADIGVHAVREGQLLSLCVDFGQGRELGDRIAWLLPVFLPSRTKGP